MPVEVNGVAQQGDFKGTGKQGQSSGFGALDNRKALVCNTGESFHKSILTPVDPLEIKRIQKRRASCLTRDLKQHLLRSLPPRNIRHERSVLSCLGLFDLELKAA